MRPDIAAEVTLQPLRRFDLDAAIIFADILLPLEPMGIGFHFTPEDGPVIEKPIRSAKDLEGVHGIDAAAAEGADGAPAERLERAVGRGG